jgi:hypothetical protein
MVAVSVRSELLQFSISVRTASTAAALVAALDGLDDGMVDGLDDGTVDGLEGGTVNGLGGGGGSTVEVRGVGGVHVVNARVESSVPNSKCIRMQQSVFHISKSAGVA